MSLRNQVILIISLFLFSFIYIRLFFCGIKRYQLNLSAYKKRKKGETFKEWLFYSRYKEEIPKILRYLYYTVLLIHPVFLIFCMLAHIIKFSFNLGEALAIFIAEFDCIWVLILALLFWSPGQKYAYERWIAKKRGQKRKKK